MKDRFFYKKAEHPRLLSFWRYLLKGRMASSRVVEDAEKPAGRRIVGFGISVFVTDAFAKEVRSDLAPPSSRRIFELWLKGRRVFLNRKEIAQGNSGKGLNLLTIHYGWAEIPLPGLIQLNAKYIESFFEAHLGYQIKEFLLETFTPEDTGIALKHNTFLRRDYSTSSPEPKNLGLPFAHALVGANREEFNSPQSVYAFALLLHCPLPRFGFTPGEKDLLEKSLLGETDQETARSLRLSIWTIKKRWQGIYGKVEKTDPLLLAPFQSETSPADENQKIERRRYLLDYLRKHMEELRPTLPVRRKSPGERSQ